MCWRYLLRSLLVPTLAVSQLSHCCLQENLPYLGLHNDLEGLLRVRAGPVGGKDAEARGVSVVYFSGSHAVMMQNFVYTAVK